MKKSIIAWAILLVFLFSISISTFGQSTNGLNSGDTIWSTTFDWEDPSDERGWSLPEGWTIVDNTEFGYPWVWMKDSIQIGNIKQWVPNHFSSNNDGCINIPVEAYVRIDGAWQANPADTYIQTPPIDCSASAGVIVSFNQYWRLCCSGFELLMGVTNDDGVHWAYYDMLFGTGSNTVTPPKHRQIEVNISDVAAGMSNVQIRFWFKNAWDYYWMIDDLTLTEAYGYDLVLEDSWLVMNGGLEEPVGHLNFLPKSQIGSNSEVDGIIGEYSFGGALINFGMMDAEDVYINTTILKNGEQSFSENTETTVLWLLDRDTLDIASSFLPEDYGDYQVSIEAVETGDERPGNNLNKWNFTVNDTLYLRSDLTAESSSNSGGWVDGYNAGDMVGMIYDIYEATEINAINAYISSFHPDANPSIQFILLKYYQEEEGYIEFLASDIYFVDSTLIRKWISLPMEKDGETEFLEPGRYVACIKSWGELEGDEDGIPGIWVGWDLSTKSEVEYTYVYLATTGAEFATGKLLNIGISLNETGGPSLAPVSFNVDMNQHILSGEFIQGTDQVDVAGTFNDWTGSLPMDDEDQDGIYSITVDDLPIGQKIEFKYRINANWDTSEFPLGGPNRTYTMRYWNVLNHVYNDGEVAGIETLDLKFRTNIYPNPSSGKFFIELESDKSENFQVTITNIQGNTLFYKQYSEGFYHVETIDIDMASGIYFITIQNSVGSKTHKMLIN